MTRGNSLFTKAFLILLSAVFLAAALLSCKKKTSAIEGETTLAEASPEVLTNKDSGPDSLEKSEYSFYSPAEDDASWVEALLLRIEEERIAEELAKMEAEVEEYQMEASDFDSESDEDNADINEADTDEAADETEDYEAEVSPEPEKDPIEKFFEEQKEEKFLLGKNDEMHFFEFDNEILSPQYDQDGISLVHSSGDKVVRTFYNKDYQLVKKEEWSIKSAADAKKLKSEFYLYSEEDGKVSEKEIITSSYDEQITYNKDALPLSSIRYNIDEENKYIIMERQWNYDAEKRLISDYQKEYFYKDKDYNNPEVFSKKYNYFYNDFLEKNIEDSESDKENTIPPDLKYYENDVLKMQYKYTAEKGNWCSVVYFDENLSVKSFYEDDVRVRDEYYNNGKLYRTKLYQ